MIARFFKTIGYCGQFVYHKSISPSDYCYEVIYEAARDLGGLYAKFMQFMGFKLDSLPEHYRVKFMTFYDQAEVEAIDVKEFLKQELPENTLKRITGVGEKPMAVGSFGQVYRATLDGNRPVILKVLKPGLKFKLQTDFLILEILVRVCDLMYPQSMFDLRAFLKEFKKITFAELDYKTEAKNAEYFYSQYQNHAVVKIPYTWAELCTKHVLVQEYVEGTSISDLMRWKTQGIDYKQWLEKEYKTDICFLFKEIHFEISWQSFVFEQFFGDPHPGNIMVLPNNQFAFIDFGICGRPPANKKNLYNFFALAQREFSDIDTTVLSRELLEFGAKYLLRCLEVLDYALPMDTSLATAVIGNYKQLIESRHERMHLSYNLTGALMEMVKSGEKFKVAFPPDLFTTFRNAHLFKSYVTFMEPDYHFAQANLGRLVACVPSSCLVNKEQFSLSDISVEEAVEAVSDWVGSIAEEDTKLTLTVANSLGKLQYV